MSVNKVILIGRVGKDTEVKDVNGSKLAQFTMATSERGYTAKDGQQVPERTEWHNVVVWRGLAEIAEKYIRKGSQIYVEGKIKTRSYDDKDGIKRYVTEIFPDNIQLLGSKPDEQKPAQQAPVQCYQQQDDDLPF